MSDNFKTYGDALELCKKYNLGGLCPPESPFILAEALLCAYKDGENEQAVQADGLMLCVCGDKAPAP